MFQQMGPSQAAQTPQIAPFQTMASAAASHLVNQQQQQQYQQPTSAAVAAAATMQQQQQHQQHQVMHQATGVQVQPGQHDALHHHHPAQLVQNPAMVSATSNIVSGVQHQSTAVKRIVKWVFSGDYLVLRDHPRGGPPPEYYVNLAYVQAPRFNRTPGDDGKTSISEPYAWEAKNWLTQKLIGQEVVYQTEYTKSGGNQGGAAGAGGPFGANANKEFGIIYLGNENVVETMVGLGLLEVRKTKSESPIYQQLVEAEEKAKQAAVGKWSTQPAPKYELIHEHTSPNSLKGKTYSATVENVRNGGAVQVYLDLGFSAERGFHSFLNASIMISGIRTPDKNRANESKFFDEAKFFTESRLLNREVKIHLEKVERNSYLASILLGQNNLAEALLKQGMARCNDASITLVKSPEKLRAAEKEAKTKRLRIWENYVDSRGDGPSEAYEAKILEVISGDSMMAQNLATGETKKIFLASIRLGIPADRERQREAAKAQDESADAASKPAKGADGKQNKQSGKDAAPAAAETTATKTTSSVPRIYDNPILYHARELLRRKLLGKKALIKVEYVQPKSDSYPEKICCTVKPADQPKWNAAEALVSKGYATVVKYVSDDSQRASNFDELLKIEQNASKTKDSKEKQKDLAPLKVVDLCNDAARAKQLFPFLSRTRKDAVIEFVFSASRFKVFLPKENNTLLNLVLAGVMVPREPEALRNSSTAAAKSLVHQRDVSIQVDSMDKKGNFIGWIYYKDENTGKETSINLQLVKLGYGQVRDSSASGTLSELKAAESVAREKKLGLWLNYQEPKSRQVEESSAGQDDGAEAGEDDAQAPHPNGVSGAAKTTVNKETELMKNRKSVVVTNAQMKEKNVIVSLQLSENGQKLDELMKQMRTELPQGGGKKGGANESYVPSRGETVAAKFSADHQWYRAKVLKVNSPQDIEILFMDYGNVEKVKSKDLAKLASKYATQEAFAKDYNLAFVEATTHDQDWVEVSRRALLESTYGQVLMRVEYKDPVNNLDAVTLVDEASKTDIGKSLVESGLLIALKRRERKFARTMNEYLNAEKTAKGNRVNMWQYGDFTADDAREFGFRSAAA